MLFRSFLSTVQGLPEVSRGVVPCAAQERKMFDERFVRLDTRRLCELTSAADALDMKPLVDLTSRALARLIEGKTPEQVCAAPFVSVL